MRICLFDGHVKCDKRPKPDTAVFVRGHKIKRLGTTCSILDTALYFYKFKFTRDKHSTKQATGMHRWLVRCCEINAVLLDCQWHTPYYTCPRTLVHRCGKLLLAAFLMFLPYAKGIPLLLSMVLIRVQGHIHSIFPISGCPTVVQHMW